ncbi:MAG: hypothetical protein MK179_05525 [Pirellulaceae bacterium]|nr:hypothetical protein [Pirellulaceae bacterium]
MKWNTIVGAVVLSVALCGQSFGGGGLLNKVLGHDGIGCCDADPSCGCEAEPSCGCEEEPSCGCEAEPSCGCEEEPSCGCEAASCGCGHVLGGLLGNGCCNLLKLNLPCLNNCGCGCDDADCDDAPSCGCETEPSCGCDAEPSCGCEAASCGCGLGLLSRISNCGGGCCPILKLNLPILGCGCDTGCDTGCDAGCDAGGDDAPGEAPASDDAGEASDAAPMPPAPLVDPSAFVPSKRQIFATNAIPAR